jgi:hypothetical protein
MTIMESIALVLLILMVAAAIAYYVQMGQLPMKDLLESSIKQQIANKSKPTQEPLENHIEVVDVEFVDKVKAPSKKKKYYPRKPKTHL